MFHVQAIKPPVRTHIYHDGIKYYRCLCVSAEILACRKSGWCTGNDLSLHDICKAYYNYQQQLWVQIPLCNAGLILNIEAFGFERRGIMLVPEIVISISWSITTGGVFARMDVIHCILLVVRFVIMCCKSMAYQNPVNGWLATSVLYF